MVSFKVDTFGGMIPALSDELLPGAAAALSQNTWLYSGSLVGLPAPKSLKTLVSDDATKVYRIPSSYGRSTYLYNSLWLEFTNIDTDVIRAPVFNDVHDRYYMASTSSPPMYNTRARLEAFSKGEPGFHQAWILGVPPPGNPPALTVAGGSTQLGSVRAATTINGALDTDFANDKKIDSVELKTGDRILIKNQTVKADNGVYVVNSTGAPTRADDMNSGDKFVGRVVKVTEGIVNRATSWKIINTTPPDITDPDRDDINFEEVDEIPLTVTRSYVYTWVSFYGEEGAPSPPVVVSGIQDGSWNLSDLQVVPEVDRGLASTDPEHARRYLTKTRIYRTITSASGVATFFLVTELPINTLTYNDKLTDDEVSSNAQLESFAWTPPPPDLKGMVVMWNGIVAGWRENELWFCEPYRPHAWPAAFVQTLEYPIVGLGVVGQTLVACTAGNPVTVNGSMPEALTTAKIANFEPCTSRSSILSSPNGVVFVSPNGLIVCGQGGAVNITKSLVTRDKWKFYAGEARLRAAWFGAAYYAFGAATPDVFEPTAWAGSHNDVIEAGSSGDTSGFDSGFDDGFGGSTVPMPDWVSRQDYTGAHNGILIDPTDQRIAFNILTSKLPVLGVQNDPWSGEVFIIRDGEAQWIDSADLQNSAEPGLWRSKIFQMPDVKNLAAMRIYFKELPHSVPFSTVRDTSLVQELKDNQRGLCRLYADGRLVFTRELFKSGELWKLPSGFMADFWQYEVETRVKILNVQIASSAKELASV